MSRSTKPEPAVLLAWDDPAAATYGRRLAEDLSYRGFLIRGLAQTDPKADGLDDVRVLLLILTAASEASEPLHASVTWAQAHERCVLPLLLSGDPWPRLADLHFTDVREGDLPDEEFFQRIDQCVQPAESSLSEGAWALLQQGLCHAAFRGFAQRIESAPDDMNALLGRGFSCLGVGRRERALKSFDRVLTRDPTHLVALAGRGEALVGLGEFEAARELLVHVLGREADARRCALPLSLALDGLGHTTEALEVLSRSVPPAQGDEPFMAWLSGRLEALSASSEVFHEQMPIERFLSMLPSRASVERCRAELLEKLGQGGEAQRARRRARRLALIEETPGAPPAGETDPAHAPQRAAVFISYSHDDRAYVSRLADWLTQSRVPVWFDDAIRTGDQWLRDLETRLRTAAAVVVVVTPSALDSTWVRRELLLADQLDIPILPLSLNGERIPMLLDLDYANVSAQRLPGEDWLTRLRARVHAHPGASISPADPHFKAGEALIKLLRVRDALREFNRGIAVDGEHADCHVGRGSALTQVGVLEAQHSEDENPMLAWIERALAAYERAVEIEPTNGNGHLGRAVMLSNLGRAQESREAARTAVRVDPANADVRSTWGAYLAQEGRFEEALVEFEAALRLNPRHSQAFQNRSYALQQLGREDDDGEALWIAAGLLDKPPLYDARRLIGRLRKRLTGRRQNKQ